MACDRYGHQRDIEPASDVKESWGCMDGEDFFYVFFILTNTTLNKCFFSIATTITLNKVSSRCLPVNHDGMGADYAFKTPEFQFLAAHNDLVTFNGVGIPFEFHAIGFHFSRMSVG